jgi:hypothetical protein
MTEVGGEGSSGASGGSRLDLRLIIAVCVVALAAAVVIAVMISQRPRTQVGERQEPLPIGRFNGLSVVQSPRGTVDASSIFVLQAEGSTGTGTGSLYWYAKPGTSTVYEVNGVEVPISEFARRLAKMPPMQVDVEASTPGTLDRVNAVFAPGAPQ